MMAQPSDSKETGKGDAPPRGEGAGAAEGRTGGDDARWRFFEACNRYQRALQDAWTSDEVRRSADEAARTLFTAAQPSFPVDEVRKRSERAREEYLRAVREAWGALDPATADPWTLAAIAQSILAAAWLAASQPVQPMQGMQGMQAGGWGWPQGGWWRPS